jgi:hypothetical protein
MTCSKPGSGTETCSCASGGSCPWGTAVKSGAFGNLVTEIDKFLPETQAKNIQVDYIPSGLGYAGDPNGADISPIVTVTIKDLTFTPKILFGLATFNLPDISASLTMEDGVGSQSN